MKRPAEVEDPLARFGKPTPPRQSSQKAVEAPRKPAPKAETPEQKAQPVEVVNFPIKDYGKTEWKILGLLSLVATVMLLIAAGAVLSSSQSAIHEILAAVLLCAAGLGWIAALICNSAYSR